MCGIEKKETLWGKQIIYDFLQSDPSRLFVKSNKGSKRNSLSKWKTMRNGRIQTTDKQLNSKQERGNFVTNSLVRENNGTYWVVCDFPSLPMH